MANIIDIDRLQDLKNKLESDKKRMEEHNYNIREIDSMLEDNLEMAKISGQLELVKDLIIEVLS